MFRKLLATTPLFLLALAYIWLIIMTPVVLISNSPNYFFNRFDQHEIYSNFDNTERTEVKLKLFEILDYMNWRTQYLDESFFSYKDRLHMLDVRNIMLVVYLLSGAATILVLARILLHNWQLLDRAVRAALAGLLILGLSAVVVQRFLFDSSFTFFHKVLFRNDCWLLDPATSNLIRFFPQIIFRELLTVLTAASVLLAIFLMGFVIIIRKLKLHGSK